MLILNDGHMNKLTANWPALADRIESAVRVMDAGDYAQPIKPYLRYGDARNRIIAMPAYLGGEFRTAGLKWIASFPGNRERGLPRAHGVIVLNRAETGEPYAMLVGGRPNLLRTAAVSGLAMRRFVQNRRPSRPLRIAIIGWGPVGRTHLDMCDGLFGETVGQYLLHDIRGIEPSSIPAALQSKASPVADWQAAYADCDICITCTVADRRYIDAKPPAGCLLLDVSLRDYEMDAIRDVKAVFVDDWDEACRENTDIEQLHLACGLQREHTRTFADMVCRDALHEFPNDATVLFCPMGMAAFDLAVADWILASAKQHDLGLTM